MFNVSVRDKWTHYLDTSKLFAKEIDEEEEEVVTRPVSVGRLRVTEKFQVVIFLFIQIHH